VLARLRRLFDFAHERRKVVQAVLNRHRLRFVFRHDVQKRLRRLRRVIDSPPLSFVTSMASALIAKSSLSARPSAAQVAMIDASGDSRDAKAI
jgi:hypothetical protein